ncbi:hypothetical protein ACFQ5D_16705 [Paenibacillus farraposensis]|uniref:Uncharacterized protein n=1 Tax=Paenibacillus farraposensis TaxID=2807095 RepID=A0ABW4DGV4_9BACL|nr:hypothetical protein [Paenibacillus farraposensis]
MSFIIRENAIRLGFVEKEWANTGTKPEDPKVSIVGNYMRME